jgi:hypothetical protein
MANKLTIENETHWKSSDILRIVRAARDEAGADPKRYRHVIVKWQKRNASQTSYRYVPVVDSASERRSAEIHIWLPKKGPKVPHPSALVALGAAGIDSATPLLAVSDSYFLANALAWEMSRRVDDQQKEHELATMRRSVNPPPWGDGETLVISKYADPARDGTFVDYVSKKEKAIEKAQARVDKWETEFERAKRNLAKAKKDLRAEQRSLTDAKKRRGL